MPQARSSLLVLTIASLWLCLGASAQANSPSSCDNPAVSTRATSEGSGAKIYIARRGWHVDVGFAVSELTAPLASLAANFPGARYLFLGFGDRRYLMAKRRRVPAMVAALWPGKALILATALSASPAAAFGAAHVIALEISREQSLSAQDFIGRSLKDLPSQPSDSIAPFAPGPYEGSLYFAAQGEYSAIHTCNTWVAEVLRAGALPVHPAGVIFAGQIWKRARKLPMKQESGVAMRCN